MRKFKTPAVKTILLVLGKFHANEFFCCSQYTEQEFEAKKIKKSYINFFKSYLRSGFSNPWPAGRMCPTIDIVRLANISKTDKILRGFLVNYGPQRLF